MVKYHKELGIYKKTILFIHGFNNDFDDWNVTNKGKRINIERYFSKTCNTIMILIEDKDYLRPIETVAKKIGSFFDKDELSDLNNITIVAHSYGTFYAYYLVHLYSELFTKLFLLDPTCKDDTYRDYLLEQLKYHRDELLTEMTVTSLNLTDNKYFYNQDSHLERVKNLDIAKFGLEQFERLSQSDNARVIPE